MELNDREGIPKTGAEQTSFGSQLNPTFENGTSSSSETAGTGTESTQTTGSTGGMRNRVKGVASSVKEKASGLPAMLADGLQAGAEALRQRRASGEVAGSSHSEKPSCGITAGIRSCSGATSSFASVVITA